MTCRSAQNVINFPPPPIVFAYHALGRAILHYWHTRDEASRLEMEAWRAKYHAECDKAGWPA